MVDLAETATHDLSELTLLKQTVDRLPLQATSFLWIFSREHHDYQVSLFVIKVV
jgi:hypothetical protein